MTKTVAGHVKNIFRHWIWSLHLTPSLSFATLHTIGALFSKALLKFLKLVPDVNPSITREGMQLFYRHLSNLQTDAVFWNEMGMYMTWVRWAHSESISTVLQNEDTSNPYYYRKSSVWNQEVPSFLNPPAIPLRYNFCKLKTCLQHIHMVYFQNILPPLTPRAWFSVCLFACLNREHPGAASSLPFNPNIPGGIHCSTELNVKLQSFK